MIRCLARLVRNGSGAVPVEYALILTLISILAIGSMIAIGDSVDIYLTSAYDGLVR